MSSYGSFDWLLLDAAFTISAEDNNTVSVAIQLVDRLNGHNVTTRAAVTWYLSEDSNGDGVLGTPLTGGIATGAHGLVFENFDGESGVMVSDALGLIDIDLTDANAETIYLILIMPDGKVVPSDAITFT